MHIREFLKKEKLTMTELADKMGCSINVIQRLCQDEAPWILTLALRLHRISDGRVRVEDLVTRGKPKRGKRARKIEALEQQESPSEDP